MCQKTHFGMELCLVLKKKTPTCPLQAYASLHQSTNRYIHRLCMVLRMPQRAIDFASRGRVRVPLEPRANLLEERDGTVYVAIV